MHSRIRLTFIASAVALLLSSCALQVTHTPTSFAAFNSAAPESTKVLANPVEIQLNTGYKRELAAGSQWKRVGRVPQGDVYQPQKAIFTLEGAHVHEAYLVLAGNQLVGFYLPVEQGYSALAKPLPVTFN